MTRMNWFGEPGRLDESRSEGARPEQTGTQLKNPKPDWARPDHKRLDFKRKLFNTEYYCEIQPTAFCIHLQYVVLNTFRVSSSVWVPTFCFQPAFGPFDLGFGCTSGFDPGLTLHPVNPESASAIQVCVLDPTLPGIIGTNKLLRKYSRIQQYLGENDIFYHQQYDFQETNVNRIS